MVTYKRYAVLPRPFSFGFTVRQAVKRDGSVNVPLPYRERDIVALFKRVDAAKRYAEKLTRQALDKLTEVSYDLLEARNNG